ncbi:hypothetical protein [Salmonella phage SP1]|uniref:Uncharacterized protein n=1 Tax=Salmonella phage SP1 TaxID=2025818 RepID=A0A249Y030_9CAUD|nr:hypothetical protein HYP23_gp046 [Salmonella phage SP1]ASZ77593.1 hypothetical protein [Salmonella phage SP1]
MKAKTFSIPIDNIGRVKERLAKLERTANRLKLEFPLVEFSEPYKTQHRDSITGEKFYRWWQDCTLTGEGIDRPVSYGGWSIIGQFNHQYPKVILNKLSDDIHPNFVQRFEAENVSWCEHCNKSVRRHNTYVVRNEQSGAQMLVGSSCMHHYVPHQKSLDAVMSYYMSIHEMFTPDEDDPEGIYRVNEPDYVDTEGYLCKCFQVLLSGLSIKSDDFGRVLGHISSGTRPEKGSDIEIFYNKAVKAREDAQSEMYHMMLFIAALSENNDFNVRLKRMCEPGYHLVKDSTTVRWGAAKYYDYIHTPRQTRTVSNWVGEVGEMLEVQVKFEARIFLYSSDYGDTYLYTFKTKEGNTITWKTSYMETEFLEGDMIIRGRVKELTEFKGIKQTQITRAKLRKL